jgi:hypothetical protein
VHHGALIKLIQLKIEHLPPLQRGIEGDLGAPETLKSFKSPLAPLFQSGELCHLLKCGRCHHHTPHRSWSAINFASEPKVSLKAAEKILTGQCDLKSTSGGDHEIPIPCIICFSRYNCHYCCYVEQRTDVRAENFYG